jgi:hypothetical protein
MALFGSGPKTESIALIDIDSTSIGAAVSVHTKGSLPTLIYTNRISIQRRDHEEHVDAMLRVLAEISDDLVIRGSPYYCEYRCTVAKNTCARAVSIKNKALCLYSCTFVRAGSESC